MAYHRISSGQSWVDVAGCFRLAPSPICRLLHYWMCVGIRPGRIQRQAGVQTFASFVVGSRVIERATLDLQIEDPEASEAPDDGQGEEDEIGDAMLDGGRRRGGQRCAAGADSLG